MRPLDMDKLINQDMHKLMHQDMAKLMQLLCQLHMDILLDIVESHQKLRNLLDIAESHQTLRNFENEDNYFILHEKNTKIKHNH